MQFIRYCQRNNGCAHTSAFSCLGLPLSRVIGTLLRAAHRTAIIERTSASAFGALSKMPSRHASWCNRDLKFGSAIVGGAREFSPLRTLCVPRRTLGTFQASVDVLEEPTPESPHLGSTGKLISDHQRASLSGGSCKILASPTPTATPYMWSGARIDFNDHLYQPSSPPASRRRYDTSLSVSNF